MKRIKDCILKIIGFKPGNLLIVLTLLAVTATVLIPLYRLCAYAIPYCDDYDAFLYPREALKTTPGLPGLIKGAAAYSKMEWYSFQGTFTSCFMMAFNLFLFNPSLYGLGDAMLITVMVLSVFLFIRTLAKDIFRAKEALADSLGLISVILTVLFIHTAQQGFYWYDGGVHYIFMHSVLLFGLAAMIHSYYSTRICFAVLSAICMFIVGGGNYSTLTQSFVVVPFTLACMWITGRKAPLIQLPSLVILLIAAAFNMLAPGNAHRKVFFDSPYNTPIKAILQSFVQGVRFLPDFLDWRTLLVLMALIPIAHRIVRETPYRFSPLKFIVFALFSVCLYASGNTAMLYSTGRVDLSRVINVIKLTFHLLLVLNELYLLGVVEQLSFFKEKKGLRIGFVWLLPAWLFVWLFFLRIQPNPIGTYSAWGADYYLKTGQAETCHNEYLTRLEILKGSDADVVFKPYTVFPWFLGWRDIESDPSAEQNMFMARYYGKNSVRLGE